MKEYKYKINGNEYSVAIIDLEGNTAAVEVNGVSYKVDILTEGFTAAPARPAAKPAAPAAPAPAPAPAAAPAAPQTVAILEAMKMENSINAECDGVITAIKVAKGDNILEGSDIVIIG